MKRFAFLFTAFAICFASIALGDISLTVRSNKQGGAFKGEGLGAPTGRIPILEFEYLLKTSRDPVTGQAASRQKITSIKITKEWGPSSPQFQNALLTNELLPSLEFNFAKVDPRSGQQTVFQKITLTNAVVGEIRQYVDSDAPNGAKHSASNQRFLEEITLYYTDLAMTNIEGKTNSGGGGEPGSATRFDRLPTRVPPPGPKQR